MFSAVNPLRRIALCAIVCSALTVVATSGTAAGAVHTTYLGGNTRTSFNAGETAISPATAPSLRLRWVHRAGGPITGQPIVAKGKIYYGDWSGYLHGASLSGKDVWKVDLGPTRPDRCRKLGRSAGVTGTPAVATVGGRATVFAAGAASQLAALDAASGRVLWRTKIARSPHAFLWSSPAVYRDRVYIGVASLADCPLIPGFVAELKAGNGRVVRTLNTAPPSGRAGNAVVSAPTVAPDGSLYITTVNGPNTPGSLSQSIVRFAANGLAPVDSWRVPRRQQTFDGGFLAGGTLFDASVRGRQVGFVAAPNKNGLLYAWHRRDLRRGPIWTVRLALGGPRPQGGDGAIAPPAFDGHTLFAAAGRIPLGGRLCKGSVRALSPSDGRTLWARCLPGPVLGAVTAARGLLVVASGAVLSVLDSGTGRTLFAHREPSGMPYYGAPTIQGGVIYVGNLDGSLQAFAPTPRSGSGISVGIVVLAIVAIFAIVAAAWLLLRARNQRASG